MAIIKQVPELKAEKEGVIPVTMEKMEAISGGRFKVKIKEHDANLIDLWHEGKYYKVITNYGRGRYLVKEADLNAKLDKEWDELK